MKKIKIIALVILTIIIICSTTGCNTVNEYLSMKPIAQAVLIGVRVNNPEPDREMLLTSITDTVKSRGVLIVVRVDGKPEIVLIMDFSDLNREAEVNPDKFKKDVIKYAEQAVDAILSLTKAENPEADIWDAIKLGTGMLSSYKDYDKRMTIFDNGLPTTGDLNFQNNLIDIKYDIILSDLSTRKGMPNLQGLSEAAVDWNLLGKTQEPQQPLTDRQEENLKLFWKNLLESYGATVEISDRPSTAKPLDKSDYPRVSVINIIVDAPLYYEPKEAEQIVQESKRDRTTAASIPNEEPVAEVKMFNQPYMLTETILGFIENTADFRSPEADVYEILTPIAEYLIQHADTSILIFGSTAGDEPSKKSYKLSEDRAEKVRQTLISLGVDPNQLYAIGLSCEDPYHIKGVGTSGELASQNRKVVLMDIESEMAKTILHNAKT